MIISQHSPTYFKLQLRLRLLTRAISKPSILCLVRFASSCRRVSKKPFLRFFAEVNHREAACGTALKLLKQVIVGDVRERAIFADTAALDILLEAGIRAVQSTPLVTSGGCIVGMISTHYRVPTRPTREQLRLLDKLAEITAEFIRDPHLDAS